MNVFKIKYYISSLTFPLSHPRRKENIGGPRLRGQFPAELDSTRIMGDELALRPVPANRRMHSGRAGPQVSGRPAGASNSEYLIIPARTDGLGVSEGLGARFFIPSLGREKRLRALVCCSRPLPPPGGAFEADLEFEFPGGGPSAVLWLFDFGLDLPDHEYRARRIFQRGLLELDERGLTEED